MTKPALLKSIGYFFIAVLVINIFLMAFRVYSILVFWIVLILIAIISYLLIKLLKN
jgi:hypothetical protein